MLQSRADEFISRNARWLVPTAYALLTLAMFGDVLFSDRIVSYDQADLVIHFVASREFGFGEIENGNIPLWSPRMFAGYPYHGGFQPALFYPLNWIFLILPLATAINFSIALHTFLAGWFTYIWVSSLPLPVLRERGRGEGSSALQESRPTRSLPSPGVPREGVVAAFLAGVIFMFCARFFLHIYAGHLPHVCLMPWTPLLFFAIDGLTFRGRFYYALIGAAALSMMILAGYPQMVYYTAVVAPIYVIARWIASPHKLSAALGFVTIAVLSIGLTAIQVLPSLDAAKESVRAGGTTYRFASSFSFPPENLLTLVAPNALGALQSSEGTAPYFGQAYLWETSTFIGVGAFALSNCAIILRPRAAVLPLAMVIVSAALGLGANLPLHRWMYDGFPGFATFRGSSKFFFVASLFVAYLSAVGIRALFNATKRELVLSASAIGVIALVLVVLGLAVRTSTTSDGWFAGRLTSMVERGIERSDGHMPIANLSNADFLKTAAATSSTSLFIAGGVACAVAAVVGGAISKRGIILLLPAIVILEMFTFARSHRPTSALSTDPPTAWREAFEKLRSTDARFLRNPSSYEWRPGMTQIGDAWGYDPGVQRRYAQLMYFSQGFDPDHASSELMFRGPESAILRLARVAAILQIGDPPKAFPMQLPPLPRALLVPSARVMSSRDEIFALLGSPGFDPSYTVLLESAPPFAINGRTPTPADITVIDTDTRKIELNVLSPSVLLVTEAYSKDWRIRPLQPPPGEQKAYGVMSGDWAFIAIPLTAGKHHFILEYAPRSFTIGKWISAATLVLLIPLIWFSAINAKGRTKPQINAD